MVRLIIDFKNTEHFEKYMSDDTTITITPVMIVVVNNKKNKTDYYYLKDIDKYEILNY